MGRRGLQTLLTAFGVVAVTFGALSVLMGGAFVLNVDSVPPSLDSEHRFFAAWYVVAGALVLRSVRRVESETTIVRAVCAGLFLGGCGRILSLITVGAPHLNYVVLMVLELVLPVVIVPWQAAVARRAG
jgi:hypothetical protein